MFQQMFLSKTHKEEYERLLALDNTNDKDTERQALFYILASTEDLRSKGATSFYNFTEHSIKRGAIDPDYTNDPDEEPQQLVDLSSGSRALIDLAFNLYNEYPRGNHRSTLDLFSKLDKDGFFIAINALKLRLPHAANQVSHIFY
jgi:hypothetical protein